MDHSKEGYPIVLTASRAEANEYNNNPFAAFICTFPHKLSGIALKEHLEKPAFNLYLGRKSCPLSLPLEAQVVPADTISGAFSSAHFKNMPFLNRLELAKDVRVFWEGDDAGFDSVHTVQRRDDPLSRRRWQFGNRTEHYAMIPKSAGG